MKQALKKLGQWFKPLSGLIFVVAAGVFLVVKVVGVWSDFLAAMASMTLGWILGAWVMAALSMVGIAFGWHLTLDESDIRLPFTSTLADYLVGEIGKYIPGGIWPIVGRGELVHQRGHERPPSYLSVLVSLISLYIVSGWISTIGLALTGGIDRIGTFWWVVLAVGSVGASAFFHTGVRVMLLRYARLLPFVNLPPSFELAPVGPRPVLAYLGAWTANGASAVMVGRAAGVDDAAILAIAAVFSWLVGFVFIPAPGGLGVREAAFVGAVSLLPGPALAIAVVSRLLFMVVDGVGAAIGWWYRRRTASVGVGLVSGVLRRNTPEAVG